MRTNNLFLLAAASLLLVNCAQKEIEVPFSTGSAVAVMENESTKSNATDEGYFTWSTGDQITIHTNNGNLVGTLYQGNGTANGTFSYTYFDGQVPTGYAMYPHSANHVINGNTLTFDMPATYNLGTAVSNTNAPMIARPSAMKGSSASLSFNFGHLGGVFRFVFKNAPAGTDKFTLSLGGSKINGSFEVDLTADKPQVDSGTAADGEGLTTLTFDALTSAQDITLFVPVPTGNYTGIEAKLYKGEEVLGTWGSPTAVNNIKRAALALMSAINFGTASGDIDNEQQVATSNQLADAVVKGGTVVLTEDIALAEEIVIPAGQDVVIDLNGNDLNGSETIQVAEGAHLTIINNGVPVVKSVDSVQAASITSDTDVIKASENSVITIGEGVSLTTTGTNCCCIWIPREAENVTINCAGNLKATAAGAAAISHNGYLKTGTINITGGSVTHEADVAVYIAGKADVTVSGDAVITGTTAFEQRAGKLTVNGGKFIATADPSEYKPNGNGTTSVGVALAVCKHSTTENSLEVVINGGQFTGAKSLLVNEDLGPVSVTVNGGTFSDPVPFYFMGDAANVTVNMTNSYEGPGFIAKAGQTAALNMASDVTYNVTNPLVGSTGTQTLGFQFLNGSNVSINGGMITSSEAKMLINNYTDLTLNDTKLAPSIPDTMNGQTYYVLSNNSGTININGNTTITAPTKDGIKSFAFDVCKYASYVEPKVTWNSTGTVTGSIELSGGELVVSKPLALTNPVKVVSAAKMTVNSTITPAASWNAGDALVIVNRKGNLTVSGSGNIDAGNNSKVYAAIKMTETGENDATNSAVLTVNDVTLKGYYYGISGNGYRHNTSITVNSGVVTSYEEGHAIYHPQNGLLTINGGQFSGCYSAIEHRGGTLNITGGEFTATYTPTSAEQNGSGTSVKGAAIAVSKHKGITDLSVSISGGTFTGHSALHEEYTEADAFAAEGTFAVTGGTFNGRVYSENYTGFITGGTFTDASAFSYFGNNADVKVGADMTLDNYIKVNKKLTIDLNGKTLKHPSSSPASYQDVFEVVTGGDLTINGNGNVIAENGYSVYAGGDAKITINNGYYFSPVSSVYAQSQSKVTINGGEYYVDGSNNPEKDYGQVYTLNLRDKSTDTATIIVKGGKYYKYNPAESNSENPVANFVAEGYQSTQDGDYYIVSAK